MTFTKAWQRLGSVSGHSVRGSVLELCGGERDGIHLQRRHGREDSE